MQFVGNFFELTLRHITFKLLKVGRRVLCSVLYTVFVGEKRTDEKRREEERREEKRREEKRREEKRRIEKRREETNEGRQRRKEREERKKKGRQKKRRRGERGTVLMSSTPPCVVSKRLRVYRQNARMCTLRIIVPGLLKLFHFQHPEEGIPEQPVFCLHIPTASRCTYFHHIVGCQQEGNQSPHGATHRTRAGVGALGNGPPACKAFLRKMHAAGVRTWKFSDHSCICPPIGSNYSSARHSLQFQHQGNLGRAPVRTF